MKIRKEKIILAPKIRKKEKKRSSAAILPIFPKSERTRKMIDQRRKWRRVERGRN